MKKLIAVLAIGLTMMSMSMTADAARRFGGGVSFGRSAPALQKATPAPATPTLQKAAPGQQKSQQQAAPNQTRPAAQPSAPSPMRGMLMGLAGILGITALAHALGLGEGFANFLMMALLAFAAYYVIRLILGMFMAKRVAGAANNSTLSSSEAVSSMKQTHSSYEASQTSQEGSYQARPMTGSLLDELSGKGTTKKVDLPADFDVEAFLKVAEENFVKMQKAWDTGNVTALSDFTTDEVFLKVTQQLRERGPQNYETEVISLKSDFCGIIQEGDDYLAGVTFTGTLNVSGEAEQINETWILSKPINGDQGWLLAGIHQEQE